jgi:putative transposase
MYFQEGYIYHIFNQGNNRRLIFLNRENYVYFLKKIKKYISPYGDILAWCLMPNHFHLMVLVRRIELIKSPREGWSDSLVIHGVTVSHPVNVELSKTRSLNDSIAILLRSYTRAFNNMHGFTGTLFRENTKAECINCPDGITPSFFIKDGITMINVNKPELQYPQICFDYIHLNPVKAKLVEKAADWEFSSARDYAGLRNGELVNRVIAEEYLKVTP